MELQSTSGFILSNIFTIDLWLNILNFGELSIKDLLKISFTDSQISLTLKESTVFNLVTSLNTWHYYSITIKTNSNLDIILKKDSYSDTKTVSLAYFIDDNDGPMFLKSIQSLKDFAWLYRLKYSASEAIDQLYLTEINLLWNCSENQYQKENQCYNCSGFSCKNEDTIKLCENNACAGCNILEKVQECYCPLGYFNKDGNCTQCHKACKTCTGPSENDCDLCKLHLNSKCKSECPEGYQEQGDNCILSSDTLYLIQLDKLNGKFDSEPLNSISFNYDLSSQPPIPNQSDSLPIIGFKRGLYLENSKVMSSVDFKLNSQFTYMFWVNFYKLGKFLVKGELSIEINDENIILQIPSDQNSPYSLSFETNIPVETWNFFAVSLKADDVTSLSVRVNKNQLDKTANFIFKDVASKLGIGSLGNMSLKGWLYSISWISKQLNSDTLIEKSNSVPALWNCRLNTYLSGQNCLDCPTLCNCRRPTDCSLCEMPNCSSCNTPNSPCKSCANGYITDQISNECLPCVKYCKTCSSTLDCECSSSFIRNHDSTCLLYCSDGDIQENGSCRKNEKKVFSFTFNSVSNSYYSDNYFLYMGNSEQFWPLYDDQDPWVLSQRGLYFSNSLATLGQPSSPIHLKLANSQQFELYLCVINPGSILNLVSNSDIIINLSCIQKLQSVSLNLVYQTTNTIDTYTLSVQVNIKLTTWYKVTWVLNSETLKLSLNTGESDSVPKQNQIFKQYPRTVFTIGGMGNSFKGFFYKIELFNYEAGLVSTSTPCLCEICPSSTECLTGCPPNSYMNVTCKPCSETCKYGCSGSLNCSPFKDPLCSKFKELNESCQTCVPGTVTEARPCKCVTGSIFDSNLGACVCKDGELIYKNSCDQCDRWLQNTEVTGLFSSSFSELVLTFSIPVQSVQCHSLFAQTDAIKLGTPFTCIFSKDLKTLSIKIGKGSTIKNEILTVNKGALKGITKECGYNSLTIPVKLEYIIDPPTPKASLTVPSTLFYKCKDFIADASRSQGQLLESLRYQWSFDSEIPVFNSIPNDYTSLSRITIPSAKLEAGLVTVTLTVKNKFDKQDSISAEVVLTDQDSIIAYFDPNIDYICKISKNCMFSVKPVSSCIDSPKYSYEWKVINSDFYSSEQLTAFWAEQSIPNAVKVSANVLPPSYLEMEVKVTEVNTGIEGSGKIKIYIKPDAPLILSSRAGGDISSREDFYMSVTIFTKLPNTATISYKWTCFKDQTPCSFDFVSTASELFISKDNLKTQSFNKIILTVTTTYILDSNSQETEDTFASAELNFNIVNWQVPSVAIVEYTSGAYKPLIKSSDDFKVSAVITGYDDAYSLKWDLKGVDSSLFITPTDQAIVVIDPSSLTKGLSYSLELTLLLDNGKSSIFEYLFKLNSPPTDGTFTSTPVAGIEQMTEFALFTSRWVDAEGNYPLTYEYGYYYQSKPDQITGRISSNEYKFKFPYKGPVLTLYVRAYDSLDEYSELTTDIELSLNENFDKSAYVNGVEDLLSNAFYEDAASTVNSVISAVLKRDLYTSGEFLPPSNEDLQNMQKCVVLLQGFIGDYIESSSPSTELIDISSSMVEGMTANTFLVSDENFNKNTDIVAKLLNTTRELGLNSEQGQKLLNAVGNSVKTDSEAVYNKTEIMKKKETVIESITSGLLKNLAPNQ